MHMLPRRDVYDIVCVINLLMVKHEERPSGHEPAYRSACMNFHVTVLSTIKKVAVGFVVEMIHVRKADGWYNVQARDVLVIPRCTRIMPPRRNPHVRGQSWDHGLAFTWGDAMAVAHWVLTYYFMNLTNGVVQYPLKCYHELHGVKVIDVMVPVSWEASAAWDHEPHIRIDIKRMILCPEISRTCVLVLRDICTDVLAR